LKIQRLRRISKNKSFRVFGQRDFASPFSRRRWRDAAIWLAYWRRSAETPLHRTVVLHSRQEVCMPLLVVILALMIPRVTILALYFLTNWFQGVFSGLLLPLLGFIFLPTTLLWYSAVQKWFGGEWGIIPIAGIVVALIIDLFPARKRRAVEAAA
jgi:hypothetical protein